METKTKRKHARSMETRMSGVIRCLTKKLNDAGVEWETDVRKLGVCPRCFEEDNRCDCTCCGCGVNINDSKCQCPDGVECQTPLDLVQSAERDAMLSEARRIGGYE